MTEIKCPNCGESFQIDKTSYLQILQQIKETELEKERLRLQSEYEEKNKSILELERIKREASFSDALNKKDEELKNARQELAILKSEKSSLESKYKAENSLEITKLTASKDKEVEELKAKINSMTTEKELEISKAIQSKDKLLSEKEAEIHKLQNEIDLKEKEHTININRITDLHKDELRFREEEIERLKDFKAKQSTKMVGESLERYCMDAFNSIRMTAFPKAYFEKDNDASSGSKGDFIFTEEDDQGNEFLSIMFEMKTEMDSTEKKHKNEDFFKELDKDRNEKLCEYAVLVSTLEADSDYYNAGIVDVSYKYPKMYVVRPQCFIPMITLLRNAALNSLEYQKELALVKNQQLDLLHFEENMNTFKNGFARNYELASAKFTKAIDDIDKAIRQLEKIRDALTSSERNLRLANDKAQDLTIKKLTKNAPSVREEFEKIKSEQ